MEISKKQCQSMHKPKAVGLTLQEIAKLFPKTTNKLEILIIIYSN